ncbi:hypothetical protein BHM03_00021074, partial [Ensete ventricosum]
GGGRGTRATWGRGPRRNRAPGFLKVKEGAARSTDLVLERVGPTSGGSNRGRSTGWGLPGKSKPRWKPEGGGFGYSATAHVIGASTGGAQLSALPPPSVSLSVGFPPAVSSASFPCVLRACMCLSVYTSAVQ